MLVKLRKMLKKGKDQKGFTLVELIIVMAILALLAGIAVPRFGNVLANAKDKANKANIQLITKAADLYFIEEKPAAKQTFTLNGDKIPATGDGAGSFVPKYLKECPEVPTDSTKVYQVDIETTGEVKVSLVAKS